MMQTNSTTWTALRGISATITRVSTLTLLAVVPGQTEPHWLTALDNLQQVFTGPIARDLALVVIVIRGLDRTTGQGRFERAFAGILFGIGMSIGAISFFGWLWTKN